MSVPETPSTWQWDAGRQSYFVFNAEYSCYIYQNGEALNLQGRTIENPLDPRTPGNTSPSAVHSDARPGTASTGEGEYTSTLTSSFNSLNLHGAQAQPQTSGEAEIVFTPSSSGVPSAYAHEYGQYQSPQQPSKYNQPTAYNQAGYGQSNYLSQSAPAQSYNRAQTGAQYPLQYYTATNAATATTGATSAVSQGGGHTGNAFRQQGKFIKGTPGTRETLNPEYKVRKDKKDFFKPGRVFKVYWSEPKGQQNQTTLTGGDSGTNNDRFGQEVHSKIRWFMVIKSPTGQCFSYCLPIQTYEGRGVAKRGVMKCYHSIIYTSSRAPEPQPNELPNPNPQPSTVGEVHTEYAMLSSIRVKSRKKSDTMDAMSRLNYIKIYPVEHNVKVYDFGMVDHGYMHILKTSFKWVQQMCDGDEEESEETQDEEEEDDDDDDDDEEDDEDDDEQSAAPIPSRGKQVKWEEEPRARRKSSAKDQERPRKDDKSKSSSGGRKRR